MQIGIVGLGRMGGNITKRLLKGGHTVIAYDSNKAAIGNVTAEGATGSISVEDMVGKLSRPRIVWIMVPSGAPTETTIDGLGSLLSPGDVMIDGGNSHYKDSIRRGNKLGEKGILFLDCGTSGGIWGLEEGYCLMVGGDEAAFQIAEPVFKTLAPESSHGYAHVGPLGAGHFVKMVHNGIEYGLMQAYAEGFELLKAKDAFGLDLAQVSDLWRYGSVVRSWLLDLTASALAEDPSLSGISAWVDDSGEGRWTAAEGIELGIPLPVITTALQNRFRSRQEQPFSGKILAAMRQKFGGHSVKPGVK